jgi:hypothetical protein
LFSGCGQIQQNLYYLYDVFRANFLNNQEAMMCDKVGLTSDPTKMPTIILQRAEEIFPALKENSVSSAKNSRN